MKKEGDTVGSKGEGEWGGGDGGNYFNIAISLSSCVRVFCFNLASISRRMTKNVDFEVRNKEVLRTRLERKLIKELWQLNTTYL